LNWFLSCSHKKPFKCCITPRSEQIKKLIESTLDLWRGLLKSKGVEETPLPFYVNNGDYLNKIFTAYKMRELNFSPLSRCQCVRRVWIQKSLPAANNKQPYTAAVARRYGNLFSVYRHPIDCDVMSRGWRTLCQRLLLMSIGSRQHYRRNGLADNTRVSHQMRRDKKPLLRLSQITASDFRAPLNPAIGSPIGLHSRLSA